MIKRYGEPPALNRRYRLRPGVYALLRRANSLLLTHQEEPFPEVQLPGGGIDAGESPLSALHREVWEETGWRIAPIRRLGAFRRFTFMPEYDLWAEKLCTVYLARPIRRLGAPPEKAHQPLWMPISQAVTDLANEGDRAFAARLMQ